MSNLDNEKDYSIDYIINELEKIYIEQYKPNKTTKKLYEQIINYVSKIINIECKNDVLYAVHDIINSNSTFRNVESITWVNIFVILGLFTTIISDIVIENYSKLKNILTFITEVQLIGMFIIFFAIEVILFCYYYFRNIESNRKRCFYELVLKIITTEN